MGTVTNYTTVVNEERRGSFSIPDIRVGKDIVLKDLSPCRGEAGDAAPSDRAFAKH